MSKLWRRVASLVLAAALPAVAADLSIQSPPADTIVMSNKVLVSGKASADVSSVRVFANDALVDEVKVVGGTWSRADVQLGPNVNLIKAEGGSVTRSVLVVLGADGIRARPPQRVYFNWMPDVDEELRQIALQTLRPAPSSADVDKFVRGVKTRVPQVFETLYKRVDIRVTTSNGPDAHEVLMQSDNSTVFGQSSFDCGNSRPKDFSQVHVGTYRRDMSRADDRRGFIETWEPMKRGDPVAVRIEDVSQALGRTAAHETGHSLGLVGGDDDSSCTWMSGCDGGHNCMQFDLDHPGLSQRFDRGWHVMDPGERTAKNARLAEPKAEARSSQSPRSPSTFEPFGRSYLELIHPPK